MLNSTIKDFLVFDLTQDIFYSFPSLRLCLYSNSLFVQTLSLQNFAPYLFCNISFANGTNFLPQADPRFLWNNYLLEPLIDRKVATQIQICDPIFSRTLVFYISWILMLTICVIVLFTAWSILAACYPREYPFNFICLLLHETAPRLDILSKPWQNAGFTPLYVRAP